MPRELKAAEPLPGTILARWLFDAEGTLRNIAAALEDDDRPDAASSARDLAEWTGQLGQEIEP